MMPIYPNPRNSARLAPGSPTVASRLPAPRIAPTPPLAPPQRPAAAPPAVPLQRPPAALPAPAKPTAPHVHADLLAPLVGCAVEALLANGTTWRGELHQVTRYELGLRREDGVFTVLLKANVLAVTPFVLGVTP